MRVVTTLDASSDRQQAGIDRHALMLSTFISSGKNALLAPEFRTMTLVVRSVVSDPALALLSMKDELLAARIRAKVIVAKLDPEDGLRQLYLALSELSPGKPADELIRWAKNPRLAEAHEQVTCGHSFCWSGDAIRRDAGKRNALMLFDEHSPDAMRRANSRLPGALERFDRGSAGAAFGRPRRAGRRAPTRRSDASVVPAALRAALQGWPLVRH